MVNHFIDLAVSYSIPLGLHNVIILIIFLKIKFYLIENRSSIETGLVFTKKTRLRRVACENFVLVD
jgi:hypothetical protein